MNAKRCKLARKLARKMSAGSAERHLVTYGTNTSTAVNHRQSTRGIYREIKRLIRAGLPISAIKGKLQTYA